MDFDMNGETIQTNEQGFLHSYEDWSQEFVNKLAEHEGIDLYVDHWELILYFREYYREN